LLLAYAIGIASFRVKTADDSNKIDTTVTKKIDISLILKLGLAIFKFSNNESGLLFTWKYH